MRRIVTIILTLAMLLTLAACGGSSTPAAEAPEAPAAAVTGVEDGVLNMEALR